MKQFCLFLFLFAAIGFGVIAHAHTGVSWEQTVGSTVIDVGYDPVAITTGQYVRFDFTLWGDKAKTVPVDFAEVWTRIISSDTKDTVLATGIYKQPIGPTTLLYEFQQPGTYSLEVSFRNATGDDITGASFPVTVLGGASGSSTPLVAGAGGLGIGAVAMWLFTRLRRSRPS